MSVSLKKGQRVPLVKKNGQNLTAVRMGLGWDPATKGTDIDLDANATLCAEDGRVLDTVSYSKKRSDDKSVVHGGDNLTGKGKGDDESIFVNLMDVNKRVKVIYFTVCSYSRQKFMVIDNASCHLVDYAGGRDGDDLGTLTLSGGGNNTGMIMARVVRTPSGWAADMIGVVANGRVARDLEPAIQQHLRANPV